MINLVCINEMVMIGKEWLVIFIQLEIWYVYLLEIDIGNYKRPWNWCYI